MKIIIDPSNNKRYSIFSKKGKEILKSFVKTFNNNQRGGAVSFDGNCGISLEPLRNGKKVCKTSEGHFYHWEFLKPWLENNNTDPLTRQPIEWVIEVPQDIVQNQLTANDYDDLIFERLVCNSCVSHLWPDPKYELLPLDEEEEEEEVNTISQ